VILINGDRIAAVGRADQISVPKNARVIDLQGRIVMPGLIDNHWHGIVHQNGTLPQQSWPLRSALAFGVTTIFDPAATQHIFSAGELVKAGLLRGPRIFSTGPTIYGAESDGTQNGEQAFIETLEDARREVRRRQAWGAIAVKSYLLPRREQRQYVVAAAREAGMFVASESAMAQIPAVSQIMDGETSIEHAISLPNVYQDILQLWRQSSIDTVPTMVIGLGGISGELLFYSESEIWRHPILSQHVPPVMLRAMGARNTRVSRSDLSVLRSARWLEQLRKAGIRVLPGSHGQREGLALHWEMWLMAEGGASAHEIFRAATLQSAEHLGVEADLGSVETGKIADLLVFDDNPLSDIRKSDRIKYVIANGIIYDPGSLNQL
jgi:imidazolonepropionase-like amidohydrolase